MTCARRLAGARKPASSPWPDACVGRRRARFSLLSCLALLLGALSLFAPAPAQAKVTIWSATLTVRDVENVNNWYGCLDKDRLGTAQACNPDEGGSLSSNTFTYRGTTYTINSIRHHPTSKLVRIGFTTTVPDTDWVLAIGDEDHALKDWPIVQVNGIGSPHIRGSSTNLLSWAVGDRVQLSLLAPTTLSLRTDSSDNQVTEGQALTVTGTLDDGTVRDHTPYTVFVHHTAAPDVRVELGHYVEKTPVTRSGVRVIDHEIYSSHIRKGRDTFQFKLHAVDDVIAELSPEPVTVTVMVDLDLDGAYEQEESIEVGVVDNDANAVVMTPGSTTLEEGGEFVSVTLTLQDESIIPTVDPATGRRGLFVRVTTSGTANGGPHANWDYEMHPRQVESYLDGDGQTRARTVSYFEFTPTKKQHTLRLRARSDGDEPTETVILTAEDVNNPGLRGTLTLRIPGRDAPRGQTGGVTLSLTAAPNPVGDGDPVTVTATLSAALSRDVTIPLTLTDDTAEAGDRGTLASLFIPAGGTSASGRITTADDADSDDETFTVAVDVANLPGELAAVPPPITVTIADGDNLQNQLVGGAGTQNPVGALSAPHAALIANIREWRDDPRYVNDKRHTDRWDRVLLAFGQPVPDASLTAMGAAEAQTYADRGWSRWVAVATALREIEAANAPVPVPVVTIAAGEPVTEGAGAGFTLTATPAPAADLAVAVSVSQSGAFADASALGARTVTIPAGTASALFAVATVDDTADEPDGAVVATLAAGSGYGLGAATSATVAVADDDEPLPAIVTKRSFAREGSDDAVVFMVRLSRASGDTVFVDYDTADGSGTWAGTAPARSGADYTAASGTLIFAPGQTMHTVQVPILDDAIDEGTEYFLLRFSNPEGATLAAGHRERQGLIRNSDPLQAMWLARFGRMVASDAVASVTARLETPSDAGSHVTVAGQRMNFGEADGGKALATVLTGFARTFGAPSAPAADDDDPFARHRLTSGWNDPATVAGARRVTGRELLLGTSFRAVLGQGAGSQWTSWGQGASVSRFSGAGAGLGLTGEAATGSMGMDYERGRLLMGFAMTHSVGEGTASDAGWRYALGSTATMAMPYARLAITDRISAWGLAGTGSGTLSLDLDGSVPQSYRTDLAMTLAATGVRGDLVTPAEPGGFALALKADAFWVRAESDRVSVSEFGSLMGARGESSRVRAMLDGSRTFSLASGAALTPKLELGVRHDAGDAETGTGLEVGAGVGYADPSRGLDMALKVHGLAVHAQDGYDEWGVSGQLRLVPGGAGRGLSMSLTPSYGVDPSGSERLWALPASSGLATNGEAEPSSRFDAEAGYGMALLGDRFTGTPNVGFGLSDTARDYRIGWRLTSAVRGDPGFEVSLDATRREAVNDNDAEHGVMLRSLIRW